jgi:hypothetical protein
MVVAHGILIPHKNLYSISLYATQSEHTLITYQTPNIETWHRRLGHANYQAIHDMITCGLIKGAISHPTPIPSKCDSCILGKQTKKPVPKVRGEGIGHRATRRLEKVWVDLSGPTAVTSRTGNNYVMNIVDDFSSFCWSIPLKSKGDAFPQLQLWERAREMEIDSRTKIYRTDNGELKSHEMANWLASRGTDHQFTAPHTSAHIGRVERMHRTLMSKARTMRIYAQLPPFLWDEFYLTASHLHTKTTTKSLAKKTPWQIWYNKTPDYSYMREIGCRAFVLIQNRSNPKIFERSIECVLVGYNLNSKSYRCYNPKTKVIHNSYHVRFLESHEGHTRINPLDSNDATTTPTIPTIHPTHPDDYQPIPIENTQENDHPTTESNELDPHDYPIEENQNEPPNLPQEPMDAPIELPPRRSSRTTAGQPPSTTRLEHAIRSSKDSAANLRLQKQRRLEVIADLHQDIIANPDQDHNMGELNRALMSIGNIDEPSLASDIMGIDPLTCNDEPQTWKEALRSGDASRWQAGFQEELDSLKEMGVYKLIPRSDVPAGCKVRKGRPVFRIKRDETGKATRWKVRLVFKGFEQVYGRDYHKTTSPTARMESWRILLHIAAKLNWDTQQIDIKTAFLYGQLPEDEIQYMEQPEGFEETDKQDWVWMIMRGLYGMKQSGRIWNKTLNEQMLTWGFTRLECEPCIYYRKNNNDIVIAAVHVDDFLSI